MQKIQSLIALVKPFYANPDPAHDWAHIGRVAATSRIISFEEKARTELVLAAVYCHDLVNVPKNHPDRKIASILSADKAEDFLRKCKFNYEEISIIRSAIIEHSFSKGMEPSSLEAAIVQDADRLDALGAIGILRCAAVNTQMKSTFYDPFDPLAESRALDDKTFMLDHYYTKLFLLPELMNTMTAKKLAEDRINYMKGFVEQLMKEVH